MSFDVLIVGGGVIGLSAAWELAKAKLKVCVVDKAQIGKEASWAASGMIPAAPRPDRWEHCDAVERLAGYGSTIRDRWYAELQETTGIDSEYRRSGALYLPDPKLGDTLEKWQEWGVEYQTLHASELREKEPQLSSESGILQKEEAQIRPPRHLRALQSACLRLGVVLRPYWEVGEIKVSNSAITEISTSKGRLSADKYCFAAGCWSEQVTNGLGIRLPMKAVRGQIALLKGPPHFLRHIINVGLCYLTPRSDGRILIGSTQEEVGFDRSTTASGIQGLLKFALQIVPGLSDFSLETTWTGLRPATIDEIPAVGSVLGLSNAWIATGHFRSGIQLAPATAHLIRAMMLGDDPPIEIEELSPSRYQSQID